MKDVKQIVTDAEWSLSYEQMRWHSKCQYEFEGR